MHEAILQNFAGTLHVNGGNNVVTATGLFDEETMRCSSPQHLLILQGGQSPGSVPFPALSDTKMLPSTQHQKFFSKETSSKILPDKFWKLKIAFA